jgi:hypothetical protein
MVEDKAPHMRWIQCGRLEVLSTLCVYMKLAVMMNINITRPTST